MVKNQQIYVHEETSEIHASPALSKVGAGGAEIGSALLLDCGAGRESRLSPTGAVGESMLSKTAPVGESNFREQMVHFGRAHESAEF